MVIGAVLTIRDKTFGVETSETVRMAVVVFVSRHGEEARPPEFRSPIPWGGTSSLFRKTEGGILGPKAA